MVIGLLSDYTAASARGQGLPRCRSRRPRSSPCAPVPPARATRVSARRTPAAVSVSAFGVIPWAVSPSNDLDDSRRCAQPVPCSSHANDPADRDTSGLGDTLGAGALGIHRWAADRVDDGINLVALPPRISAATPCSPLSTAHRKSAAPASRMHGCHKVAVLPRLHARTVDRRTVLQQLGRDRGWSAAAGQTQR